MPHIYLAYELQRRPCKAFLALQNVMHSIWARTPEETWSLGKAGARDSQAAASSEAMKNDDVSEGSRELVDLSAEAVSSLGIHLAQIGQIISKSQLPPNRGEKSSAHKLKNSLEMYQGYTDEVQRRRMELEQKMADDFARLKAWRAQSGTEGKGLVEELEALYGKVRQQDKEIKKKQQQIEEEQARVKELEEAVALRERKWDSLAEDYGKKLAKMRREIVERGGLCSWLQCAFDEIRFKWKAAEEKEKLKIEHHQRMRKARAQARLDVIQRERKKRLIQACMVALQEESIEGRHEKHLEELRRRHNDEILVMNAQLAQALGDEEKAKELVQEQVRRAAGLLASHASEGASHSASARSFSSE
eukprot:s8197_g2.t1